MKYKIFTVLALLGSTVAELFGGWDTALKTLLIFMVLDWFTGRVEYRRNHTSGCVSQKSEVT